MGERTKLTSPPGGIVPGDLAVFDLEIADQRDQEAAGHGIDKGRTALDRALLGRMSGVERLRRHCLQPVGKAGRRRHRRRQNILQFRRAAEHQCHRLIGHASLLPVL